MSDNQLVTRNNTAISHASESARAHFEMCARDLASLHDWQRKLEADLLARLQQASASPGVAMSIQRRAEECFQALMAQGVQRIESHAAGLSASANREIEMYKERVASHMEERLQTATARAHAAAQAHAEDLRNENQLQIDQSLQHMIEQASAEATSLVVAATNTHLETAGRAIVKRTDDAVRQLDERFERIAMDRIQRLLKDTYSSAQLVLQTFADEQVSEIRRRVQDHVGHVVREVRSSQESEALASIRAHAIEEARLLSRTIATRIDEAFSDARNQHAAAMAQLEADSNSHESEVHLTIQRQVEEAWERAEVAIKKSIASDLEVRLAKHCRDVEKFVQDRVTAAQDTRADGDAVQKRLEALLLRESAAQSEQNAARIRSEVEAALKDVDVNVMAQVARALAAAKPQVIPDPTQLELVRKEVQAAVQDLDVKIADATRFMTARMASERGSASTDQIDEHIALVRQELKTAIRAMDEKIEVQVSRMTANVKTEGSVAQESPTEHATAAVRSEITMRHDVLNAVSQLEFKVTELVRRALSNASPARPTAFQPQETACTGTSTCAHQTVTVSNAAVQTNAARDEATTMEEMMQSAWDNAIDEEVPTPTVLRSLQSATVGAFVEQLHRYWEQGGKKPWTSFLRPGLYHYIKTCELNEDSTEADVLVYLDRVAQTKPASDPERYSVVFSAVTVDDDATTAVEKAQSVLLGLEEAIVHTVRSGVRMTVPLSVYMHVVLEKLPTSFRASMERNTDVPATKKAFNTALLKAAREMDDQV